MKKEAKFIPEAATKYAKDNGIELPKKIKNPEMLVEIIQDELKRKLKGISEDEQFECESCKHTVLGADTFCWYCGADISEDGTGGFIVPLPVETAKVEVIEKETKALVPAEKSVIKPLKEYTETIRSLNANTGVFAWKIGKYLIEIEENKLYRQGNYTNMADYVTSELDYSWQTARNFMRYAQVTDVRIAEKLGVYKLELVARSPETARDRMIKAALPKPEGLGMSREALEDKLKEEKAKAAQKGTEVIQGRGRKPELNKRVKLSDLVGQTFTVKIDEETSEGSIKIPDTSALISVKVLKASVRVSFYDVGEDKE